jgi:exodeoxyribonuclease V gamma subunit
LFAANETLMIPRPLAEWTKTLREILHTFFDENEESAAEMRQLRATIDALATIQRDSGFGASIGLEVVRAHLVHAVERLESGHGFLAGGVSFCALKPMRSIPFKVICLIGMDDTAFPRSDVRPGFDVIAEQPRAGDPSRRDDDRQIFLEALLSARDRLYISYCGLSPKEDNESPPSVVVSELLDHLRDEFVLQEPATLVLRHPLQAFSPRYFDGTTPLFSYSAENFRACTRTRGGRTAPPPFAGEPISPPGPEWNEVDIAQLAEFFANPARFFLRHRLKLRLPDETMPLEECEPMTFEGLRRYQLESDWVRAELAGATAHEMRAFARAAGSLPAGWIGELSRREMEKDLSDFVARVRPVLSSPKLGPLPVALAIGAWRLGGTLHDIHTNALVRQRPATIRAKDLLRAWIGHLVLNAVAREGYPRITLLFGKDGARRFPPVANAATLLESLLAFYAEGLRAPLRFFPESSLAFLQKRTSSRGAGRSARQLSASAWEGSDSVRGERDDRHVEVCFRNGEDPRDDEWERLSERILQPLLDAMDEIGDARDACVP